MQHATPSLMLAEPWSTGECRSIGLGHWFAALVTPSRKACKVSTSQTGLHPPPSPPSPGTQAGMKAPGRIARTATISMPWYAGDQQFFFLRGPTNLPHFSPTPHFQGHFRTARAQRGHSANYYGVHPGNTPCKPPPYRSTHDPFKTASGMRHSGPWHPWLPLVESSRLFAQRGHSAGTAWAQRTVLPPIIRLTAINRHTTKLVRKIPRHPDPSERTGSADAHRVDGRTIDWSRILRVGGYDHWWSATPKWCASTDLPPSTRERKGKEW